MSKHFTCFPEKIDEIQGVLDEIIAIFRLESQKRSEIRPWCLRIPVLPPKFLSIWLLGVEIKFAYVIAILKNFFAHLLSYLQQQGNS